MTSAHELQYAKFLAGATESLLHDTKARLAQWLADPIRFYGMTTEGEKDRQWDRSRLVLIDIELARRALLATPTDVG